MSIKQILVPDVVALHLKGTTKEEIIDELLQVASRTGKISDLSAAKEAVLDREKHMSTGMKHGIAIPHGKTNAVKELVAVIGISDTAVDFDAFDHEPCRIFIMTLSPLNKAGPHLQFLAEVSVLFRSEEMRRSILAAQSPEAILATLS